MTLPVGPVRLEYGIPLRANRSDGMRGLPLLDAPGRGYQELKARFK